MPRQRTIILRFPRAGDLCDDGVPAAVERDRGRTLFRSGSRHYTHYQQEIDRALAVLTPDVVIGEATLFHELLAIAACREKNLPYLHPTATRYPAGRLVIFDGNTQIPVSGSDEIWPNELLKEFAGALLAGNTSPDYMRVHSGPDRLIRGARLAIGNAWTIAGRMRGERYNTPSLARKLGLEWRLRANLADWRSLARVPDGSTVLLYPLQKQPESNIDVWGAPFSNQIAVIQRCLSALPEGGQVAVKVNPKAKYEVSDALIALAHRDPRVVLLPIEWGMSEAHQVATIGAVTVTGTVGYEAVFGCGRCISLRHPLIKKLFPALHADSPEEAVGRLLSDPKAGKGGAEMAQQLLERLVASSFPGLVNNPANDPVCLSKTNIERVCIAIERAVEESVRGHGDVEDK